MFTGMRPGEKLYEELLADEIATPTARAGILRVGGEDADWQAAPGALETLERHALDGDDPAVRAILAEIAARVSNGRARPAGLGRRGGD